ncbi:MAG: hypothetical protein IPM38_01835 [Ignavibacteria bacterium]|nr:hypothetical protein [Ignavibacteria bacterium]
MKNKFLNRFSNLLFYFSILTFIIAFNFRDNLPPGGWYQQFMPTLDGASISDITFTDSLNGYAVTLSPPYILKTTNEGDNWTINYSYSDPFIGFSL